MTRPNDNLDGYRQRATSRRRQVAIGIFTLLLAPVMYLTFFLAQFDPSHYAPALIAAVDQETGRQLTVTGPVTLRLSLKPVIVIGDLELSNPPGFADPEMLTLARVKVQIALFPLLLHRLEILDLDLVRPVITLERAQNGVANWDFSLTAPGSTPEPGITGPAGNAAVTPKKFQFSVESVEVQDAIILIKNGRTAQPAHITIQNLAGSAASVASPLHLMANATLGNAPFQIAGMVGPIERFSGFGAGPWPIDLTLTMGGATASLSGAVDHPETAQGYKLAVNLQIPALEALSSSLSPSLILPAIHGIEASARIADQNSSVPAIDQLSIKTAPSDLSSLRPGLKLNAFDLEMASLDQPLTIAASGMLGQAPISLTGKFGAPQALLNPALLPATMPPQGSFPVSVAAQLGNNTLSINGAIATPETLSGAALALNAAIPDLSTLSAAAGISLPAWKNIAAQASLIDPGGSGLWQGAGLDGLTVTLDNATFSGAGSLYFGPKPRLQLALNFSQLNIDALLAAFPQAAITPAEPATPAASTAPLPDEKLPLRILKTASADIQLSADTMVWNQADYTALQGHAVLANGILNISPVTGQLPGGSVTASATLNATADPAAESVNIAAPALALGPLLKTFGLPDTAQGTAQFQLSATSTGDDTQSIANHLGGQFGLATANAVVDGSVMSRLFGTVLGTVGLPAALAGTEGPVPVRCAALRVDAANGIGTIRALTLDSSRLRLQGGGTVNFGNQTLSIILGPQLHAAGTELGVPVELGGSFASPTTQVAPAGALMAAAKTAIGLPVTVAQQVLGDNSVLAKAANILGLGSSEDVCPAALDLARMGQPGPAATPLPAPETPGAALAPALNGPKNLLNSLFGQ